MWDTVRDYWLKWAMGIFAAGLAGVWAWARKRLKGQSAEQRAVKEACVALLHDRLYQACKYYLAQGYIDVEGLNNIEHLYRAYHDLGGNGTGTELYSRVKALPIRED